MNLEIQTTGWICLCNPLARVSTDNLWRRKDTGRAARLVSSGWRHSLSPPHIAATRMDRPGLHASGLRFTVNGVFRYALHIPPMPTNRA